MGSKQNRRRGYFLCRSSFNRSDKNIIISEFGIEPLIVSNITASGIVIKTDKPERVGSDRIADAVGAVYEYGAPIIIIDMVTATTISIVNKNKEFIGV